MGKVLRNVSNGEEVPRTVLRLEGDSVVEYQNVQIGVEMDRRLRDAAQARCRATGRNFSKLVRKLLEGWLAGEGVVVDYGRRE